MPCTGSVPSSVRRSLSTYDSPDGAAEAADVVEVARAGRRTPGASPPRRSASSGVHDRRCRRRRTGRCCRRRDAARRGAPSRRARSRPAASSAFGAGPPCSTWLTTGHTGRTDVLGRGAVHDAHVVGQRDPAGNWSNSSTRWTEPYGLVVAVHEARRRLVVPVQQQPVRARSTSCGCCRSDEEAAPLVARRCRASAGAGRARGRAGAAGPTRSTRCLCARRSAQLNVKPNSLAACRRTSAASRPCRRSCP